MESREAEADYLAVFTAVLNVKKEVKQSFREKGKEKYLINHVKCFLLHFRQTKMILKLRTDACECCITLTNIKIPRKRKYGKFKKAQALFAPSKVLFVLPKKSVNREPFLVRTTFFTFQNFLNCHHAEFKDAVGEKIWRPTISSGARNVKFRKISVRKTI